TYNSYNCEIVGLFNGPVQSPPSLALVRPASTPVAFTNLNDQLRFTVNATDDGIPGPLSVRWTTVSGPTNALFENPYSLDTVANFPLAGLYVVRCSADDTVLTNSVDVTVSAGPIPTDGADSSRVLWLKLDESSGTTASDSSGAGNNGTVSGGATWQPTGGVRN